MKKAFTLLAFYTVAVIAMGLFVIATIPSRHAGEDSAKRAWKVQMVVEGLRAKASNPQSRRQLGITPEDPDGRIRIPLTPMGYVAVGKNDSTTIVNWTGHDSVIDRDGDGTFDECRPKCPKSEFEVQQDFESGMEAALEQLGVNRRRSS